MGIAERVLTKITANRNLLLEASLCSRFRTPKSGCSQCADRCPEGAISLTNDGPEISANCAGCGICFSVCRNDVFRLRERGDEQILNEIAQAAKTDRGAGREFCISCERGYSRAELLVPCLGRLTEALLLAPVKNGFSRVVLIRPECSSCPKAKASSHIDRTIERAAALFEMLNLAGEQLAVRSIALQPMGKRPEKAVTRRELFATFRTRAVEITAAALPEGCGTTGPIDRTFLAAMGRKAEHSKRGLLLGQLRAFAPGKEVSVPTEQALLATIAVSSRCNACGVCATLCPSGALSRQWDEQQFTLSFRAALCANCRVCAQTCLPLALTIENTTRLNDLLEDTEKTAFAAARKSCSVCRMNFVRPAESADLPAGLPDSCPTCREEQTKRLAFINNGLLK
jgi:Pyruvate/2-oxoacid:ferredoxin oxidoreductase delta subunit